MDTAHLQALAASYLPTASATDDKYSRGVVGLVVGSEAYPGAAILAIGGAQAAQVGMVRYVGPRRVADLALLSHPETVVSETIGAAGRVNTWVLGSGVPTDDAAQVDNMLAASEQRLPTVLDAGALEALDFDALKSTPMLLTPHAGELERLVARYLPERQELRVIGDDLARSHAATALAARLGQTVLAKGNVTFIAGHNGEFAAIGPNSPQLATAGTGDVLAGLLGGLASHRFDNWFELAPLAVWLHSQAAELAGEHGAVVASDLPRAIPEVIARLRKL